MLALQRIMMNMTNPVTNAMSDMMLVIDNPNPRRDCFVDTVVHKTGGIVVILVRKYRYLH